MPYGDLLLRPEPAAQNVAERGLLRFLTCGSVDDGKSTLIGRLLYDSGLILDDQLEALERDSRRHGTAGDALDFALLVDGLEAERQQGITIDVAYRFFATPRRSFIVADTPGHEQYTRNMATGASTADLAVLLVDARKGLLTQTKRHSYIAALLGIRHVVLAVNKIDLVGFDQATFDRIEAEYRAFAAALPFAQITAVPLSARGGDNVAQPSTNTPWYAGPTLLDHLETVDVEEAREHAPFRFPVQWVNRPDAAFRGYAGTLASGTVRPGDPVVVAGSGRESRIARIVTADGDLPVARAGDAVTLTLADEVDVSRGDLLAPPQSRPETADGFAADVIWLSDEPLQVGPAYWLKIGTRLVLAHVDAVEHRTDVNTLKPAPAETLGGGDVGLCRIRTAAPIAIDAFDENRTTGAFILIHRESNATVAAGMVRRTLRAASNIHQHVGAVDRAAREARSGHKAAVVWFTGLSGSGKSTIADHVEQRLNARGMRTFRLDGDNLRHGLNRDLGFSPADRDENIRRSGEVARLFVEAGTLVLCSFISPYREERARVRGMFEDGDFFEVFVDTPLDTCIQRDPKGLYARALAGEIANFTGVSAPYEAPTAPDLRLDTSEGGIEEQVEAVIGLLDRRGVFDPLRRVPPAAYPEDSL
jgi:bifunctional enzyme CysN/CysC